MGVDRRIFLGGGLLAGGGLVHAAAAASAGGSVTDFGVEPNWEKDQTGPLQKAIDALSQSGRAIHLPSGSYRAEALTLPAHCSLIGVPGQTRLNVSQISTKQDDGLAGSFVMSGLTFLTQSPSFQVKVDGLNVRITDCSFWGGGQTALQLDGCSGYLDALQFQRYDLAAISAADSGLTISGCRFADCGAGVVLKSSKGAIVSQNQFNRCGMGIAADGVIQINSNRIDKAAKFGLKLGRDGGTGRVMAQSNLVQDCEIGIGVSASGDTIFASLNLIHGSAKGAIRAFDGQKLVGPDLAQESAEHYLNLTVAGNVVR